MNHHEGEFEGANGLKIYYQAWLPDNPKAVVQIVHGGFEHSGRYLNVVNELIPRNYAVYADDHRGNGKSEGTRNYVDSFDQFIDDEKKVYDIIKNKHPDLPVFMLGHSMGAIIAAYFAKKYEELLAGLILSGTTASSAAFPKLLKIMVKVLSKITPKLTINPNLDPNVLSRDPEVVKAYQEDPYVHAEKMTIRLAGEITKYIDGLVDVYENFTLPLLVQCGSEDKLMKVRDFKEDLINVFKMEDKEINIYEGLYHEVYNELKNDRIMVLKDLTNWLEKHV
ncbi:MAG: alpha/beta hydrolase [Candidatus Hermodarchaeota archaeon]